LGNKRLFASWWVFWNIKISLPLPNSGRAKFTPSPVSADVNLAILHDKAWFIQEYPAVKNKKPKFLGNRPTKASNDDLY